MLFRKSPIFTPLDQVIDYPFFFSEQNKEIYQKVNKKNNFLNPLPCGTNLEYKKYMIISTNRTGSTLLSNLLRNHSAIVGYYEVFNPDGHGMFDGIKPISKKDLALRFSYPVDYLNHYVFRNYPDNVQAVGFKIMYQHLSKKKYKLLLNNCFSGKDGFIIHLKRANKLQTLVSLKLAQTNNLWFRNKESLRLVMQDTGTENSAQKNFIKYAVDRISLSIKECTSYFEKTGEQERAFDELLAPFQTHEIYYEDLAANEQAETDKITDKLGLVRETLYHNMAKQNELSLEESIINYQELKEHFKQTRWSQYFAG